MEKKVIAQDEILAIMKQSRESYAAEQAEYHRQLVEKTHSIPKTEKEKKLAALAAPKDKITHKDVLVGRGVVKEQADQVEEGVMDKLKAAGKKVLDTLGHGDDEAMIKDLQKKAGVPQTGKKPVKEAWEDMLKAAKERKGPQPNGGAGKKEGSRYGGSKQKDEKEVKEEKDTPGQSHVCAVHVKHSSLGEGKTLFSQHADPAADGSIAWYDVMFEHGIEKKVPTADLEIVVAESHMNHKKKPMREEIDLTEAAKDPHPDAVHVSDAGNGKYKVHAVGKNFADGIKVGEHLSDSELDDFSEMGGKVKMVKEKK